MLGDQGYKHGQTSTKGDLTITLEKVLPLCCLDISK